MSEVLYAIYWKDKKTGETGCNGLPLPRPQAEKLMKYLKADKGREYWIGEA
jgi:hypothetical protein